MIEIYTRLYSGHESSIYSNIKCPTMTSESFKQVGINNLTYTVRVVDRACRCRGGVYITWRAVRGPSSVTV